MRTALVIAVLLLLLGPLRRPVLGAWKFVLPATAGTIAGLALARLFVSAGGPAWLLWFAPVLFGLQLGAAGKAWLDRTLGPPRPWRR